MKNVLLSGIFATILLLAVACNSNDSAYTLPTVTHTSLSNLHGFNLTEKFTQGWHCLPFEERDFKLIAEYGFNFVRLPMDYRCITVPGHWDQLDDEIMKDLDQALEWGEQYGIHVCINLHHAPGFCINSRDLYSADSSLWTGTIAQDAFVALWQQMAERYKGVSNDNVSFNLLNEPVGTSKEAYLAVAIRAIEAIRAEDPKRLIMSDGWNVGRDPIPELAPYDVIQMFRGYWPMSVSHCGANWVDNTYGPIATWPSNQYLNQYIQSKNETKAGSPFVLKHTFETDTKAELAVIRVYGKTRLSIVCDEGIVLEKAYDPDSDNLYDKEKRKDGSLVGVYLDTLEFTIPAGTKEVHIAGQGGEWISYGELKVYVNGPENKAIAIIPGNLWGDRQEPVLLTEDGFVTENDPDADWEEIYIREQLKPWMDFKETYGVGIMVGEWGVFEKAPREASMEWMKFMLSAWEEADLGWAVWNFRGTFGVADNNRPDTEYTEVDGLSLDVEMLELLKEYAK